MAEAKKKQWPEGVSKREENINQREETKMKAKMSAKISENSAMKGEKLSMWRYEAKKISKTQMA
jgi:hypothetical protein